MTKHTTKALTAVMCTLFIILLTSCEKEHRPLPLAEREYYFATHLTCLAPGLDSTMWVSTNNGELIMVNHTTMPRYRIADTRISSIEVDPHDSTLWIGTYNNGLQHWAIGKSARHLKTYAMEGVGDNYTVSATKRVGDEVYVATGHGLYATDGDSVMRPIYHGRYSEDAAVTMPHMVYGIGLLNDSVLAAATIDGTMIYDMSKDEATWADSHDDPVIDVSVVGDSLYLLHRGMLHIYHKDNIKEGEARELKLNFPAVNHNYASGYHFLTKDNILTVSQDLVNFNSTSTRRSTTRDSKQVVAFNPTSHRLYMLTDVALWQIPLPLTNLLENKDIKVITLDGHNTYHMDNAGRLYMQTDSDKVARKIMEFDADESVMQIEIRGNVMLYTCNDTELRMRSLNTNPLSANHYTKPRLLYNAKHRIARMAVEQTVNRPRIMLAMHDYTLLLDDQGQELGSIPELYSKCVTDIYCANFDEKTYVVTRNYGIFTYHDNNVSKVANTDQARVISDMTIDNPGDTLLWMIGDGRIYNNVDDNWTPALNQSRLLMMSDTTMFTIGENGLIRYRLHGTSIGKPEHIITDLAVNVNAVTATDVHLWLGTHHGTLCYNVKTGEMDWVTFDDDESSLWVYIVAVTGIVAVILAMGTSLLLRKRKQKTRKASDTKTRVGAGGEMI